MNSHLLQNIKLQRIRRLLCERSKVSICVKNRPDSEITGSGTSVKAVSCKETHHQKHLEPHPQTPRSYSLPDST